MQSILCQCQGIAVPEENMPDNKGVQQAAADVGTKSTGERLVQFALKVNF